ncbi:hypothetical protein T07_10940 [Trichinella nelsoni]|uniref:Uncharacterized protein n=1 Tax=Trichinella nelsoni TaxID=6336 RepID=A0A0V0RUH8_9BILA|nr:hypothetical protein T07_10940 [Trichinella nelsoni]
MEHSCSRRWVFDVDRRRRRRMSMPTNWATKVALGWVATDVRLLCIASLKRLLGDPSPGGRFFERLSKKGANYDMFSVNSGDPKMKWQHQPTYHNIMIIIKSSFTPFNRKLARFSVDRIAMKLDTLVVALSWRRWIFNRLKLHEKQASSQPVDGQQQQQQQQQ